LFYKIFVIFRIIATGYRFEPWQRLSVILRDFQRSGTEKHYSGGLERAPLRAPKALLSQAFIRAIAYLKPC